MKIDYCDEYDNAILRVNKKELSLILGVDFGDKYGNNGEKFNANLIGKQFELNKLSQTKQSIQVAHELKERTAKYLRKMANEIEHKINFSIPELEQK